MKIIITYPTALEYWLSCRNTSRIETCSTKPIHFKLRENDNRYILNELDLYNLTKPYHILVPQSSQRSHGPNFKCHKIPKNLPAKSFVQLTESIYIICPELCFLLAAKDRSIGNAAVLACDLCAIYRRDSFNEYLQSSRVPITSVAKIQTFLNGIKTIPGIEKARISIQYAFDRSNSPRESKIAVICSLPCMHGGFGLPRPILNENVTLSTQGSIHLNRKQCCCDLVWKDKRIIAEYDSDLAHLSANQMHYDKRRSTALQASDYTIIHITRDCFRNFHSVDELFELIRKALGIRSNRKVLKKYESKRYEVIKSFFYF